MTTPEIVFAQFSSIDVDKDGTIHVLFNAAKDTDEVLGLFYLQSTDGGATFSEPERIGDVHIPNISPDQPTSNIVGVEATRMYPCPHLRVDKSGGEHDGNIYESSRQGYCEFVSSYRRWKTEFVNIKGNNHKECFAKT